MYGYQRVSDRSSALLLLRQHSLWQYLTRIISGGSRVISFQNLEARDPGFLSAESRSLSGKSSFGPYVLSSALILAESIDIFQAGRKDFHLNDITIAQSNLSHTRFPIVAPACLNQHTDIRTVSHHVIHTLYFT